MVEEPPVNVTVTEPDEVADVVAAEDVSVALVVPLLVVSVDDPLDVSDEVGKAVACVAVDKSGKSPCARTETASGSSASSWRIWTMLTTLYGVSLQNEEVLCVAQR